MLTRRLLAFFVMMVWACETPTEDPPGDPGNKPPTQESEQVPGGGGGTKPGGDPGAPPVAQPFSCDPGKTGTAGEKEVKLAGADGKERLVLVHVPAGYDPLKGTMLITSFHGYGGNAEQMRPQTNFDAESDKRGFIVAYVQGVGAAQKGFNGGDCCGTPAWGSEAGNLDDVGLAKEIVKRLSNDFCIDPKRVHNAGFSNGGFMSYRMICEASDVYASIASVSGVLGVPPEECKPTRPVPIIHVHGTNDKTVAYEGGGAAGGLGSLVGIKFRSVAESVGTFRKLWTCGEASKELSKTEDTRCEEWSGCAEDAKVELCTVTDGGHQWPGGKPTPVGGKTSAFGATNAILDFFTAHPMK